MNLIMCCAVYKGDTVTERGLRTMSFEIPGAGKKPLSIPIKLLPSFAAGETTAPNAFEEGLMYSSMVVFIQWKASCTLSLHNH